MTETIVTKPVNPLLAALRIPGETFRLPSQGLFYNSTAIDETVHNGELELYPMTAIDEIIISTPDKLLSGKAITEVFTHCIPQIKDTSALLAKDVDFLMICLRMVSFGQFMEVTYTHSCENGHEHTYTVDLLDIIRKAKSIDPTTLNEEYKCTLPNGQVVSLKPMCYGDIIDLYQDTMTIKTEDMSDQDAERMVINTMVSMVQSVDDVTNKEFIAEWLSQLKLGWKKELQQAIQAVSDWGIDMKSPQICKDCGDALNLQVSANPINFFI